MLNRPSPQDIRRFDYGKFIVLLLLSTALIVLLILNELMPAAQI